MTALNMKAMRGKVPRVSPRLLPGNFGTEALNCKLVSGAIDPLKGLTLNHTSLAAAITTMYRYRHSGTDYLLVWADNVVDVARSPVAQDARGSLYYTGDGEPKMTTFADGIVGGGPHPAGWFVLGVYFPTITTASINVVGGGGATENRAYVYTFVTQYGEESAPSPAILKTGFSNATSWDISGMEAFPPNSGTVTNATIPSAGIVEVSLNNVRGLAQYEEITFAAVGGMTDLNGTHEILSVDVATNRIRLVLTTVQVYTAGGTWARRAPHNTTNMKRRIYRTVGTNTDYKYVGETTGTTFVDNIAATALGNAITTLDSYTPPKNGHSLVELANGAHAMLAGNELCFSEIGKPYSWPIGNRYSFAGVGVAAVSSGNSVVVATDGAPVLATATVPEAASVAKMEGIFAPCLSKVGTVDTGNGALIPSHDGLWLASPGGARNVTAELYSFEEWQALLPATLKAAFVNQTYYGMHDSAEGTAKILVLDMRQPDSVLEVDDQVDALHASPYDGKLYVAKGNKVYEWDSDDTNRYFASWKSAEFQLGKPTNFSVAQVHADYSDIVPLNLSITAANAALLVSADNIEGALGATEIGTLPIAGSNLLEQPTQTTNRVQFTLLNHGAVVFSKEISNSKPFRLPAGFKMEIAAAQIASSVRVYSITVAQGMDELKRFSE